MSEGHVPVRHFIKAILFGSPGIGKTSFLASGAGDQRFDPCLLVNVEAGTLSIESKIREVSVAELTDHKAKADWDDFSTRAGKIDVVRASRWRDLDDIYNVLYDMKHPYKTVLVDSLSEVNRLCLKYCIRVNHQKGGKGDGEQAQLQDFGRSNAMMNDYIRDMRDLKMHVFTTALPETDKDDFTGKVTVLPSFNGKLSVEIPAMVDIVGYMFVNKEGKRAVRFQPDGKIEAKDRSEGGKLGEVQENFTLPKLFDLLGYQAETPLLTTTT